VTAKTVHPLFPDFDVSPQLLAIYGSLSLSYMQQLWKLPFAQVIFDSDPAVIGKNPGQQSKEMSRAMIRSPLSLLPLSL
jgi:hypothetical protein